MIQSAFAGRLRGLDLLRAAAILLVLMSHYMGFVSHAPTFGVVGKVGWAGVDLFFVLSGYLIGNQLLAPAARADCANATTQADMDSCAGADFRKADAALNRTYAEVMARLGDDAHGKQALIAAVGCAWAGLAVWAKPSVVCSEITSPAVVRALRKIFRMPPIMRPMRASCITPPATPATVEGTAPMPGAAIGARTRASRKANASRTRAGTAGSPTPGSSMTMAATRTKTSPTE